MGADLGGRIGKVEARLMLVDFHISVSLEFEVILTIMYLSRYYLRDASALAG